MATLDIALTELENILTGIQSSAHLNNPKDRVKLVIETRSKVIKQIAELTQLYQGDTKIQGNAELARQFSERLQTLRHTLAGLQAKWRAVTLEEDFQAYASESRVSAQALIDFIKWARSTR